jgi:predicted transcriptional regulator
MTGADDSILEFFEETGIEAPPAVVQHNIDFSITHVRRRMRKLEEEGLLEKADEEKGYYGITELGSEYLQGDLEADDLEK